MLGYKIRNYWGLIWIISVAISWKTQGEVIENFPLHFRLAAEICVANSADNLQCQKTPFEDDDILQLKDYVPGQMLRGSLTKEIEIPCGMEENAKIHQQPILGSYLILNSDIKKKSNTIQKVSAEIIIDKVFRDKKPYHLTLVIKQGHDSSLMNLSAAERVVFENSHGSKYLTSQLAKNFNDSKVFTHSFSEPSQIPRLTFDSEICYLKNGFSSYQVKISPPWH